MFNILSPEEAERTWGDDQLRVEVDLEVYEQILAGQSMSRDGRGPDLTYFGPAAHKRPTEGDPTTQQWSFHYLSGDQDRNLPGIAAGYFTGYLRLVDGSTETGSLMDFEKRFRYEFPLGCMSIA